MVVWTVHCSRKAGSVLRKEVHVKKEHVTCNHILVLIHLVPRLCSHLKIMIKKSALSRAHLCWKTDNGDCNTYSSDAVNHLMCLMNACQYNVVLKVMQVTPLKYPSDEKPAPHKTAHTPSTLLQGVHSTNLLPHLWKKLKTPHCFDAGTVSLDSNVHSQLYKWMIIIIYNCTDDLINILLIKMFPCN